MKKLIILLSILFISISGYSQFKYQSGKASAMMDSLLSNGQRISIRNKLNNSECYFRTSGDTLYFGDVSGEKALNTMGGSFTSTSFLKAPGVPYDSVQEAPEGALYYNLGTLSLDTALAVSSDSSPALSGYSLANSGLYGFSATSYGIYGESEDHIGIYGTVNGGIAGIYGTNTTGVGIYGQSQSSYGIEGISSSGSAIYGSSSSGIGINGYSLTNKGIQAISSHGVGLYCNSTYNIPIEVVGVSTSQKIAKFHNSSDDSIIISKNLELKLYRNNQDSIIVDPATGIKYYKGVVKVFEVDASGNIEQTQLSCALTDDTPTAAEIVSCAGSAATLGAGTRRTIKDSNGTGKLYRIESDGTDWYYTVMIKSL